MRWPVFAVSVLASLGPVPAQVPRFSFGAVGGVRLSGAASPSNDESRRYTAGPSIEVRFGDHIAVEFDALYKRLGYSFSLPASASMVGAGLGAGAATARFEVLYYALRNRAHSWEFPVLGKYYLNGRRQSTRFFVGTGYSFQRAWTTSDFTMVEKIVESGEVLFINSSSQSASPVTVGAVFAAGVTRKAGPITFVPSFRYTRWGFSTTVLGKNQSEFLLGIRF